VGEGSYSPLRESCLKRFNDFHILVRERSVRDQNHAISDWCLFRSNQVGERRDAVNLQFYRTSASQKFGSGKEQRHDKNEGNKRVHIDYLILVLGSTPGWTM